MDPKDPPAHQDHDSRLLRASVPAIAPEAPPPAHPDHLLTDEELMVRLAGGEISVLEALFVRHEPIVSRTLLQATRSRTIAEDLTQSVFIALLHSKERYNPGSPFKPLLHCIVANVLRSSRKQTWLELFSEEPPVGDEVLPATPPIRDHRLALKIWQAIQSLPSDQRESITLHRLEGLSFAEVARTLGIRRTTAKVRAHRGYKRLRKLLREVSAQN